MNWQEASLITTILDYEPLQLEEHIVERVFHGAHLNSSKNIWSLWHRLKGHPGFYSKQGCHLCFYATVIPKSPTTSGQHYHYPSHTFCRHPSSATAAYGSPSTLPQHSEPPRPRRTVAVTILCVFHWYIFSRFFLSFFLFSFFSISFSLLSFFFFFIWEKNGAIKICCEGAHNSSEIVTLKTSIKQDEQQLLLWG